jgi:hypothetical protein
MKNKPFAWEDFVNQLPNLSKQSDIIETAGKLVRIRDHGSRELNKSE